MKRVNRSDKGMVLVTVLIIGAIVILLGAALLSTGVMEVKSGNYYENKTQAYYVAKAGADIVAKKIIDKDVVISSYPATFTGSIVDEAYTVNVTKQGNEILINSIGQSKNVEDEVVLKLLEKVDTSTTYNLDMAIFSNSIIELRNGVTITGDVVTNSNIGSGTDEDNGYINGNAYVGQSGNVSSRIKVSGEIKKLAQFQTYQEPKMPSIPSGIMIPINDIKNYNGGTDFVSGIQDGVMKVSGSIDYTFNMTSDVYLSRIDLLSNNDITINVGNKDRVIVVDVLNADSGNIYITGSGSLTMYVTNTFHFRSSYINWDDSNLKPQKFNLYYYGNNEVSFISNSRFCGKFQSELAPLTLSGGGNFNGTIISATTDTINVSGGHQAYTNVLYAPKASVTVSGGGQFKGCIISKRILVSGGGSVIYNSPGDITIPVTSGGSETYEKINYQ